MDHQTQRLLNELADMAWMNQVDLKYLGDINKFYCSLPYVMIQEGNILRGYAQHHETIEEAIAQAHYDLARAGVIQQYVPECDFKEFTYYSGRFREINNPGLRNIAKYKKAYKWYCESCGRSNEQPVDFHVYQDMVPMSQVDEMIEGYHL